MMGITAPCDPIAVFVIAMAECLGAAAILHELVPGVPVLAGRNRAALGEHAATRFGADVLLLDDGFQHYRLERDVDLVCIDAELGLGNGHVLPRGPLRESPRGLNRADAIVFTRACSRHGGWPT